MINNTNAPFQDIYHLQTGNVRRSLERRVCDPSSTLKIKDLGVLILRAESKEGCEFVLNENSAIPYYRCGEYQSEPSPLAAPVQSFYVIDNKLDVTGSLTTIYQKLTGETPLLQEEEVGPLGLFTPGPPHRWKPLETLTFFQRHAPLSPESSCAALASRSLLVVTDISGTAADANHIPAFNSDEEFVPNY